MYSEKLIDSFIQFKNAGDLKFASITTNNKNEQGQVIKLSLKINPDSGVIEQAKYKYFGSVAISVCVSILCDLILNKTLSEAQSLTEEDILDYCYLPNEKKYTAKFAIDTLRDCIKRYYKKTEEKK